MTELSEHEKARAQKMAREMVEQFKKAFPVTTAVMSDPDTEKLRTLVLRTVTDTKKEGDIESLELFCAWFVVEADRSLLHRFIKWLEEVEPEEGEVK